MKNKQQEALERLCKVKIYQKEASAYDYLGKEIYKEEFNILQELVAKETPMKVIEKMYKYPDVNRTPYVRWFECPNCYQRLHTRYRRPYCSECGQHLDWSDDDEC